MTSKKWIFLFTLVYLTLSVILYFQVPNVFSHQDMDSRAYIGNALVFCNDSGFGAMSHMPTYALGYPMFVGLIYKVFGVHNFYVVLIQLLLALFSGFLIFNIAKRIFNDKVALISFALFSINLGYLVFPQLVLTDMLLSFLLLWAFERFVLFVQNKKMFILAQSAFLFGLSAIVKPAALYYIFFLLLFLIIYLGGFKENKLNIVALLLCFYLPIVGYVTHNKVVFNKCCVSRLAQDLLHVFLYSKVRAVETGKSAKEEMAFLMREQPDEVKRLFDASLKQHPEIFFYVWFQNVAKSLFGLFASNLKVLVDAQARGSAISFFYQQGSIFQKIHGYITMCTALKWVYVVGYLEAIWTLIRYILVLVALIYMLFRKQYVWLFLLLSYLFYFSIITGFDGCSRYRMMFEFVLIILSASGIYNLSEFFYNKKNIV